jgi:hypothetical protein
MSVDTNASVFVFSACFDALFLNDLYGGDMHAAAEVFGGSAGRIRESANLARVCLSDGAGSEPLRRVLHRIKPVFGYTGLNALQDSVGRFEALCTLEADRQQLLAEYLPLEQAMLRAAADIEREHARLADHINGTA